MNAAVTLSGPFARQGRETARGLAQWADEAGVALTVVDDGGSRAAARAYGGWLEAGVDLLGLAPADLPEWRTSTLLGDFALDGAWRQVGHRVTTIRWRGGRMVPAARTAVQFPRGRDS